MDADGLDAADASVALGAQRRASLTGHRLSGRSLRAAERQHFQIWMIDLRTAFRSSPRAKGENEDPSWAPDGRHIVFTSSRGGDKQFWILDAESGRARQPTHNSGSETGGGRRSSQTRKLELIPEMINATPLVLPPDVRAAASSRRQVYRQVAAGHRRHA